MVVDEDHCYPAQTYAPDGTMQSRRVTQDSTGVRCTFLNIMRMFGRIEYFSTWGWVVGCPVVQGEAGGYSRPQTIPPVENDERASGDEIMD
jgi:hypothetical protein